MLYSKQNGNTPCKQLVTAPSEPPDKPSVAQMHPYPNLWLSSHRLLPCWQVNICLFIYNYIFIYIYILFTQDVNIYIYICVYVYIHTGLCIYLPCIYRRYTFTNIYIYINGISVERDPIQVWWVSPISAGGTGTSGSTGISRRGGLRARSWRGECSACVMAIHEETGGKSPGEGLVGWIWLEQLGIEWMISKLLLDVG